MVRCFVSASSFAGLFGQPAVRPLQEHIQCVVECDQQVLPFFNALVADDWKMAEEYYTRVARSEYYADTAKKEIRLNVAR